MGIFAGEWIGVRRRMRWFALRVRLRTCGNFGSSAHRLGCRRLDGRGFRMYGLDVGLF